MFSSLKHFLTLNILSLEDKILIKTYENVKDFLSEDGIIFFYKIIFFSKKLKNMNISNFL